jgi:hypothetical protein
MMMPGIVPMGKSLGARSMHRGSIYAPVLS